MSGRTTAGEPSPRPSRLFRRATLRRREGGERPDDFVRVVRPRSWLALFALGTLTSWAIAWSVWGRVPVTVQGRGVLIHPRRVVELQSPVGGTLDELLVSPGQEVRKGQVLGRLDRSLLRQQLAQKRDELARRRARQRTGNALHRKRLAREREGLARERKLLERQIAELREQADRVKRASEAALSERRSALREQLALFRDLSQKLQERVRRYEELEKTGVVSKQILLQLEETALGALQTSQSLETQLGELTVVELRNRTQDMERRHRILDLENKLHDLDRRELKLAEEEAEYAATRAEPIEVLERDVARLEEQLAQESRLLSPYSGRVIELSAVPGQVLRAGARIGLVDAEDREGPLQAVVCFPVAQGLRVRPGMPLQVSPDAISRQRYGTLRGQVAEVRGFPVTSEELAKIVGNPELARALAPAGGAILVFGRLERAPQNPSGYAWTSSQGPPHPLAPGTTIRARVVLEQRSPLSFVLPILRAPHRSE